MSRSLCLATENSHKVQELNQMLASLGWSVHGLDHYRVQVNWTEDADSFAGNARIKAQGARKQLSNIAILADDSGLVVPALRGAPGVRSSRYAGEQASDQDNLNKLLVEMRQLSGHQRRAAFVCVLCYLDENGQEAFFEGRCEGQIVTVPSGTGGFGYDPIFLPDGFDKTLAALGNEEKNKISHRRHALDAWLKVYH